MNPAGYTNQWGTPAARLIRRIGMIKAERAFLTALASRPHCAGLTKGETRALAVDRTPARARHDPRGLFPHRA